MRLLLIFTLSVFTALSVQAQQKTADKKGVASFYHDKFEGRSTATGEVFDNDKFTAASNKIKLNAFVKVTNLSNGEVVYVRVNDRMAKTNHRLIDLASIAARKLDFKSNGIADVKVEIVPEEEGKCGILAQREMEQSAPVNKL